VHLGSDRADLESDEDDQGSEDINAQNRDKGGSFAPQGMKNSLARKNDGATREAVDSWKQKTASGLNSARKR